MSIKLKRYAVVSLHNSSRETIERYLPSNYQVAAFIPHNADSDDVLISYGPCLLVEGRDDHGWTLDGYVLPRLASGLHPGHEIDLSHPVMKELPDA